MNKYIAGLNLPHDLKTMEYDELEVLTYEIRDFLIEKVSKTGGHLSSNLGAVELSIALHRIFDAPGDKIIWDVGHQTYVHKILTGRAEKFDSLRQLGGMSGFPKSAESPTTFLIQDTAVPPYLLLSEWPQPVIFREMTIMLSQL